MIIIDILDNVHNSKCLNSGKVFLRKIKKKKRKKKKKKREKKRKEFHISRCEMIVKSSIIHKNKQPHCLD
jgi:hypothetical protein